MRRYADVFSRIPAERLSHLIDSYIRRDDYKDINANTTAQTQKILDAIAGNRMADMQNQINQLQLQAATCNVMRFPNQWTYAGGYFPPTPPTTTTGG